MVSEMWVTYAQCWRVHTYAPCVFACVLHVYLHVYLHLYVNILRSKFRFLLLLFFFIKFLKNWSLFALFYIDQFLRDKGVILSKAKNENKLTVSKKFN